MSEKNKQRMEKFVALCNSGKPWYVFLVLFSLLLAANALHAAFFLFDPDGRLELVCLLDKEGSRTSVQTNLIFNGNFFDVHSKTLLSIIVLGNSICFLPVALYLF